MLSVGNIFILGKRQKNFPYWALECCAIVSDGRTFQDGSCCVCNIGRVDGPEKYTVLSVLYFEQGVCVTSW